MAQAVADPLPFRLLIDEAVKHTRDHFRRVYLPVAIPVAIAHGIVPVVQALTFNASVYGPAGDPARAVAGMAAFLVVVLLATVTWGLGYGALVVAAVRILGGGDRSMAQAWLTMVRPKVLGTSLIVALATFVGCALCVLPGFFLALLFSLVVPVMVAEGVFGPAALARSVQLLRYNPQGGFLSSPLVKVFVIFVLGYLLATAVGFVIQLPFGVATQIIIWRAAAEGKASDPAALMASLTWMQVPGNMLSGLASTAVQIYMAFAVALFYFDLRRRQEAGDLEAAIRELAEGAPPPPAAG